MKQERLLSDEELLEQCKGIISVNKFGKMWEYATPEEKALSTQNALELFDFINTQKRLYAESENKYDMEIIARATTIEAANSYAHKRLLEMIVARIK